ncbi:MAG: tetratricopeptide repeat protein [Gemmataceae bacterium]|nr:tetratricopeptide repeat protein [Gemmataceae bacterium]
MPAPAPTAGKPRLRWPWYALLIIAGVSVGGWVYQRNHSTKWNVASARLALHNHRLLEAEDRLRGALRHAPKDSQVLFLAARVARRRGALDDAEAHLRACEHDPATDPDVWVFEKKLLDVQRRGVSADAEPKLRAWADQTKQDRTLIYEALAEGCLKELRIPAAMTFLDEAVREAPDNIVALRRRGRLHLQLGNLQEAVADFRAAADLEPAHAEGRALLADSLVKTGRFQQAAPLLEQLRTERPDDVTVLIGIALCHVAAREFDQAAALLSQALERQPGHALALLERGRLELEQNRPELAEGWLRKSLAADPADRRAHYMLFQCLRLQAKDEAADRQLADAKRVVADLNRLREIITDELARRPGDVGLHHELGVLYLRNGQAKQGIDWLERALKLDARHRPTHQALAEYYDKAGQPDRAAVHRGKLN